MSKKYTVCLSQAERTALLAQLSDKQTNVRSRRRSRLLLDADCGPGGASMSDEAISERHAVSVPTIARLRRNFAEGGLELALKLPPPKTSNLKLDLAQIALLRALAASPPPEGRRRWSLRLLATEMGARHLLDVSYETIRNALQRERALNQLNPSADKPAAL